MTVPSTSQLNMWNGTPFTNTTQDEDNIQFVSWLTSGSYDMNFGTVTATTYNGLPTETFSLTTGEDITAGDIVRISGGLAVKATNASDAGITGVVGVATETVVSGGTLDISNQYYESYGGLTVGATYYIGTNGEITSTNPGIRAYIIGVAVSATRLNLTVKPKLEQKEVRNTGFITKTLPPFYTSGGASARYKIIDASSGTHNSLGLFMAQGNAGAQAMYSCSLNAGSTGSATQISSGNGIIFGIDSNNSVYVNSSLAGNYYLQITYFLTGTYDISQLLDEAVQI